jgi:hypothetical protein
MRRWQPIGLIVGVAALFLTARPARAQVWIGPPAGPPPFAVGRPTPPVWPVPPVGVVPPVQPVPPIGFVPPVQPVPPIGFVPGPVVVIPGWGARPYWRGRPYWGTRRAYRRFARGW